MQSADSAKRWLAFLRNHREAIAATDFFTVPTMTFGVLYCFFVISHNRRRILHFNVTNHPTSQWIVQRLRDLRYEVTVARISALGEMKRREKPIADKELVPIVPRHVDVHLEGN
jgi:hypothetical protein